MNQRDYRAAFDRVEFRPDFQQETVRLLRGAAGQPEKKEQEAMKIKHPTRMLALAAALVAVLVLSVSAATMLLSPRDVANQLEDPVLAAAFQSEDAMMLNEVIESEGYRFTMAGLISGKGLSAFTQNVDESRTYAVAAVSRVDGTPIEEATTSLVLTPLVEGYAPQQVNAWTLGGGYSSIVRDGVAYYLFDCQSLQLFADHAVYLAAYEGFVPGPDVIATAEDGTLSFADGVTGPRALFTLPLDPAQADPAAAAQFLADCGIQAP